MRGLVRLGSLSLAFAAHLQPRVLASRAPPLLRVRGGRAVATAATAADVKLAELRQAMAEAGVAAFVVPSGDAHLSEYTHPAYDRRAFISGFTGSAGTAVVTADAALLWTDGRYFLQAEQELLPVN
jgi:Xaa-Pro aminopeptidase